MMFDDDFRTLSMPEMQAILLKHKLSAAERVAAQRKDKFANTLTWKDFMRAAGLLRMSDIQYLAKGGVGTKSNTIRPGALKALSRFMLLVEAGLVKKVDRKLVYLSEPEPGYVAPRPTSLHRVAFSPSGRPRLLIGPAPVQPRQIEGKFFGSLKTFVRS